MRPMIQERRVDDSMVGSSVLATAERTSGYGDSSSGSGEDGSKFGSSWLSMATPYVFPTELECVSCFCIRTQEGFKKINY